MIVLSFWTSTTINILHNSSVQIIPFKLEKITILLNWRKNNEGKGRCSSSVVKERYSRIQIMTLQAMSRGTFYMDFF